MDHIEDLQKLRDAALARLQGNPDYRTLRALTALIDDLTLMDTSRASVGSLPSADDTKIGPTLTNGKGPGRVANFAAGAEA